MDVRLMLIATGALGFATVAAAEPAKPVPTAPSQDKDRPVLLAAAQVPPTPAPGTDAAPGNTVPARKPRAARVTTCRCADTPNP